MEATFARIRQATGVNTLEEMIFKLVNQSTNHTTLEEEKREAESKLSRAKAARQSEDARFSCMKASGVGNTELNRDISDKLNAEIQEYRVEVCKRCGDSYTTVSRHELGDEVRHGGCIVVRSSRDVLRLHDNSQDHKWLWASADGICLYELSQGEGN